MKLAVAAPIDEIAADDEVEHFDEGVVIGEILEPADLCDRDRFIRWPGGCGCGRAFRGMSSHKLTTCAVIADVPITREELRSLVADANPDHEQPDELVDQLIDDAAEWDVGYRIGIWRHQYETRP